MSWEMQADVIRHSQTSGRARTAMMAVAYYVDRGGNLAYASNETIVVEHGVAERTLQLGLRDCEDLGELQRQPQLEDYRRRRVYIVAPAFRRQAALPGLDQPGAEPGAGCHAPAGAPASSRAGVREEQIEQGNDPLRPLTGGTSILTSPSPFSTSQPRVERSERATPAARRRARRRRSAAPLAPGPCPLSVLTDSEVAALTARTASIIEALKDRYPPDDRHGHNWRMRSRTAHLHTLDPLTLAFSPDHLSWIRPEFGAVLQRLCGPLELVACEEVSRR